MILPTVSRIVLSVTQGRASPSHVQDQLQLACMPADAAILANPCTCIALANPVTILKYEARPSGEFAKQKPQYRAFR